MLFFNLYIFIFYPYIFSVFFFDLYILSIYFFISISLVSTFSISILSVSSFSISITLVTSFSISIFLVYSFSITISARSSLKTSFWTSLVFTALVMFLLNYISLGLLGTADLVKATVESLLVGLGNGMKYKVTIKILMLITRRKLCSRISTF